MEIITGRTGQKHVRPSDDGQINRTLLGKGDYILYEPEGYGNQFKITVTSATTISVGVGYIISQGRHAVNRMIEYLNLEDCITDTGYSRIVTIVAEYTENQGIESFKLTYEKGQPYQSTSSPIYPPIIKGNIDRGERHQVPLWNLRIDHFAIDEKSITRVLTTEVLKTDALTRVLNMSADMRAEIETAIRSIQNEIIDVKERIRSVIQFLPVNSLLLEDKPISKTISIPLSDIEQGSYKFKNGDVIQIHINGLTLSNQDYTYEIDGNNLKLTFNFVDNSMVGSWDKIYLVFYRLDSSIEDRFKRIIDVITKYHGSSRSTLLNEDGELSINVNEDEFYIMSNSPIVDNYGVVSDVTSMSPWVTRKDMLTKIDASGAVPSITSIGYYAFTNCKSLLSANFPQATSIEEGAFNYCESLSSANLPQATSIGTVAFRNCKALTTANFPQATSIGGYAFNRCESLSSANFPQATSIEEGAFNYCISLITVDFPQVTSIGDRAFYNCNYLTSANFPQATSIGEYAFGYAFYSCTDLTTVSFPKVTSIGDRAFYSCNHLENANFPQATSIGGYAFYNCVGLTNVNFPQATSIGESAFCSCVVLPNAKFSKVTSIGANAFYNCFDLMVASFPQATSIGEYAFYNCRSLTAINLLGSSIPTLKHSNALNNTPMTNSSYFSGLYGSIYVPSSLFSRYKTAQNWSYYSSRFVSV